MNASKPPAKESKSAKQRRKTRGEVYDSILQTVGMTPIVRLPRFMAKHKPGAEILAKLEFMNPMLSVKNRHALAMIEEAEKNEGIKPGKTVLIDATAGDMGISLAWVAAAKGYKLILAIPENIPYERRKVLAYYGAELVVTPANKGMHGAIEVVKERLEKSKEEMYTFRQFENPVGPKIHAETTAEEIWNDTNGEIDILVAGVGTGATISGIAGVLKKKKPGFKAYAVEPAESPVLTGGKAAQHKIQGIGAGFVPATFNGKVLDGVLKISSDRAFELCREIALLDGIPCGISSGAALAGALVVAGVPENKGKMIVTILPSFAERYMTSPLFEGLEKRKL
ncbi:MAG: cysteine synthase A [Alphaproteobacteria bacterium]|nr:cysteine synthase A [Alphaproteobacteria bacterium]